MTDQPTNPFESILRQTQDMAQDWMKTINPALAGFNMGEFDKIWPTMPPEMLEAFMGKQFNPDGLEAKTRLLLMLQGLTIQGAVAAPQIRLIIRNAIAAGASQQEIAETIGIAALFGGAPAMQKAMDLAKDVFANEAQS
jgi:4-carboxymuconolactone decarboxylase